ncbi:MAG TPA: molybdenum ABC transporter ATP-binding protein [Aliiroseovarius sp.]|nr:molybdenum ABC transporter ATP-binding protein [Aliiroseovarius sp.]
MTLSLSLRHAFGPFGLDVAFDAPAGITMLFGRSGSGKTTVINAAAGLLRPDQGHMRLDGDTLFDTDAGIWLPPHQRRIGYIFQDARLFPHLSVRQNLTYGRFFTPKAARREDLGRVVDLLGLGHLLARRPNLLSGGEKQRVAIGRALMASPRLILADEPLAALDDQHKAEIMPYFERLRDDIAVPILFVSHSPAEVARLATSVVVLQDGRVARHGSAAEVLADATLTPLGVREVGAVLEACIAHHHADGLTRLDANGVPLFLPRVAQDTGSTLRIRIAAQDVMLARDTPRNISALNILPGTISAIRAGDGPGAIVTVDTKAGLVLSRITRRSLAALDLQVGTPVTAIVKTIAIAPGDIGGTCPPHAKD